MEFNPTKKNNPILQNMLNILVEIIIFYKFVILHLIYYFGG